MRMSTVWRCSECLCVTGYVLQLLIFLKCSAITLTTTTTTKEVANGSALFRDIGRSLTQCLGTAERWKCLEKQLTRSIDAVAQDNSTWKYGDFIIIEKVASNRSDAHVDAQSIFPNRLAQRQRSLQAFEESVPTKGSVAASLLHLAKSRSIRFQLPSSTQALNHIGAGISNAIDGLALESNGPSGVSLTPAEAAQADEGRKKKDKDKNMAMMGGMAMMAMFAQMFLGKVILIAGAAFVMAKIALLVSVLGSLKKGSSGSSGSTEHIVLTSSGHGGGHENGHSEHSYDAGWHRSMPLIYPETEIISKELKHEGKSYHTPKHTPTPHATHPNEGHSEFSEIRRRQQPMAGFL